MKNYQVTWSDDAEFDLENIITYIMIDSIDTAKEIFYAIKEACQNKGQTLNGHHRPHPKL